MQWRHACRVEPLVGRCAVTAIALGHSHTLFLDSNGAVYSCGENQEAGHLAASHLPRPTCSNVSVARCQHGHSVAK